MGGASILVSRDRVSRKEVAKALLLLRGTSFLRPCFYMFLKVAFRYFVENCDQSQRLQWMNGRKHVDLWTGGYEYETP